MSRPVTYTWSLPTNNYVALLQNVAAPGPLVLKSPSPSFPNQLRTITLTSANNLSGVNFTITGASNTPYSQTVTETIAGPNANTVSFTHLYSQVYSITVSAPAAGVSAGIGLDGILGPFTYNFHDNNSNLGISVQVTNTITYSLVVTLDDITKVSNPAVFNPIPDMTAATTNQMANLIQPLTYAWLAVATADPTASIRAIFIQQGLHS